jgi:hypothetical protein
MTNCSQNFRDAGGGVAGGSWGARTYKLTLFELRGADYARHITTGPSSFWTMRRASQNFV